MSSVNATTNAPRPDRLMEMAWGFAGPQILTAALQLDLFHHVANGATTLSRVIEATKGSKRGVTMLVDALVATKLLERSGPRESGTLALAPDVATFLVPGKPSYLGDFVRFHAEVAANHWLDLAECVRTGEPLMAADRPTEGVPLWHQLVDSLFNLNLAPATALAKEVLRTTKRRPLRVLDVACGSGVWGVAQAQADPTTRVTFHDLAESLDHARRFVARESLASRAEWLTGDLRSTDFGEARFDVAVLGHICHCEGATQTRKLFGRLARALAPGGTLAIAEFVPDDDRAGPPIPLVFALNMLVHTTEGATFTFAEYREWLEAAGFKDVRKLEAPAPSPLILATR
jgi:ubiquinone/menaquinone biosynthesis C-methylase UbiE